MRTIDHANLNRDDIHSLDQALYVASCLAASSPTREVAILCKTVKEIEHYRVIDAFPGNPYPDWTVYYYLRRPRD